MERSQSSFIPCVCLVVLSLAVALFFSPRAVFSHENVSAKAGAKAAVKKGPFAFTIRINYDDPTDGRLMDRREELLKRFTVALPLKWKLPSRSQAVRVAMVKQILYNPTWVPTPSMQEKSLARTGKLIDPIPPGSRNPLGKYFLWLICINSACDPYVAIHGNGGLKCRNESCIGKYVSAGCIRMYNKDVKWLVSFIETEMAKGKRFKVLFGYFGKDGNKSKKI